MRQIVVSLLLTLFTMPLAVALALAPAQPAVGAGAKVDALFAKWDKTETPGLALAVVKDGQVVHQRGFGMANLELGLSITTATVFLIASLSKHFTVFCILLLAQGGRLSLDDDVRKHVPEVPDFGKKITIRHLISHTSGLREYLPLASYAGWRSGDTFTEGDVLGLVSKQKDLNFEPGEKYLYCNTGYELLGLIVKRVSGKSLRDYAQENLFEPLGMRLTQFRDDYRMLIKGWAGSYTPRPGGGWQYGLVHHGLAGASNIHTTVEDLAIWDRNFYDARVGGPKVMEQMHQQFVLNSGKKITYAGGLHINQYRGLKTVDHTGSHGGFRTILLRFPEQKFSVILLANASDVNTSVMARKVADIYLEKEFKDVKKDKAPTVIAVDSSVYERYVGEYLFETGWLVDVRRDGEHLVAETPLGRQKMQPLSETEFWDKSSDGRLVFAPSAGKEVKVVLHLGGSDLPGKRLQPVPLTDEQRQEFTGLFYSDELEVPYHVSIKGDKLWLRHRKGEFALRSSSTDEFVGDFGEYGGAVTLDFARNAQKCVTGFALNSGRVKNLKFAKVEIKAVQ